MKFIRRSLTCLALAAALAVVLVAAAFVPAMQTSLARYELSRGPARGSLGSLSADLEGVEVADLSLEIGGAVLTVPSLTAKVPMFAAIRHRDARIGSLEAHDWTLDLSRTPGPPGGQAPGAQAHQEPSPAAKEGAARRAILAFHGLLGSWVLPCSGSMDGVDLEGDVLVPQGAGNAPARVHITIKGGGLAPGHEGSFTVDATTAIADPQFAADAVTAHGGLVVALGAQRTLSRISLNAEFSDTSGRIPSGQSSVVEVARGPAAGDEDYTLALSRGGRDSIAVLAHFHGATRGLEGSWKLNLRDPDLTFLALSRPIPSFSAVGEGTFEAEPSFDRMHVSGRMDAVLGHLGTLARPLEQLGTVNVSATFEGVQAEDSLRVDRLSVSFGGTRPTALFRSLQPIDIDEANGRVTAADPMKDLLQVSVRQLPLAGLTCLVTPFIFSGGMASGEFALRAGSPGMTLDPKGPLSASGVSISRAGRILASDLDISLSLQGEWADQSWAARLSPLMVGSGGRHLATIEAKVSQPTGADQPVAITGTWKADLEAAHRIAPSIPGIAGRSASGDFTASVGSAVQVDTKLAVVGSNPSHALEASVHADIDENGTVEFSAPTKLMSGTRASDVMLEGTWPGAGVSARFAIALTGNQLALGDLRLLFAPLGDIAMTHVPPVGPRGSPQAPQSRPERDKVPFWGDRVGRLTFMFGQVTAEDEVYKDVSGAFGVERGSLDLQHARCAFAGHTLENIKGSITFDALAEFPYELKAAANPYTVDASVLFPRPKGGEDPLVEGRFSVESRLNGNGFNLADLVGRTQEELRMTSTGGIFRALKTNVAESIPEVATPATDTLSTVGSAVGTLFGVKSDLGSRNPVSKTAQAVMDLTNNISEIGFDKATITAIRGYKRSLRIVELSLTAPDERITGSGEITYVSGKRLGEMPLSVDLQIWARGKDAQLLSTAGLLSSQRDAEGYRMLGQSIRFGGSLGHIDQAEWHDLLAKAATRNPAEAKKGN